MGAASFLSGARYVLARNWCLDNLSNTGEDSESRDASLYWVMADCGIAATMSLYFYMKANNFEDFLINFGAFLIGRSFGEKAYDYWFSP